MSPRCWSCQRTGQANNYRRTGWTDNGIQQLLAPQGDKVSNPVLENPTPRDCCEGPWCACTFDQISPKPAPLYWLRARRKLPWLRKPAEASATYKPCAFTPRPPSHIYAKNLVVLLAICLNTKTSWPGGIECGEAEVKRHKALKC